MSKSLQKGILFAVCILLVCALGVTLFLVDGTGMVPSVQEGQASAVAQNTAKYTHGSNIGRALPSDYTSVSDGKQLKAAIEANNKDIVLTNDVTLQTIGAFWANNYLWNDNSQCFDSDGNGNTKLKVDGFTHKIYGQGYTIEVQGPHAATGEGMQQNSNTTYDYGGLFPKLGNNGAVYDARIYITKGFSGQTQEAHDDVLSSYNPWLNVGGIAGSLIGNAVIDNVTVEIARGVKLASYKWSDGNNRTKQYVRVGAIAGEINNTASISNVTVINNGRLESGQYISEAKFSPDSDRYYGAAGNVVGWISNATTSINNVRVEGSGTLYSYYVANIANAIGSTVSVNNFYNNFTGTFDAKYKYSNTLGQGEGSNSTLTVTNHYKKGALASTAGTDNTVGATNTLTVPNNLTLYFIPNATRDSERLGIAFSGTTYSSANDYTVTGLNNAEKTASGGFSAAPSGGTLALGLPVGANNWKTDGTFASITATPKFNPTSYAKLTKYDHGYVAHETTNSGTKITQDNFASYFQPGGQANNQSGTYYLTEDVVVTGFTGINFSGTFDGNGHTIFIVANNTTSGSAVGGLVGNMTGGTIKNVRVVILSDLTIGTVNGRGGSVGGLVGAMSGGASLENVQVVIESEAAIRTNMASDTAHSLGGVVGRISGVSSLTNVTLELKGTLAAVGSYTYTGGIAGNIDTIGTGDTITFKNIIVRGNGTFNSRAANANEPPYYAALGILERSSGTNAEVTIDGLIYDANPTLTGTYNGGTDYAMYGIFSNNNWSTGNTSNNVNYHQYVTYSNIFFTENAGTISDDINTAKHNGGNAIIPIGNDTTVKTINNTVTGVDGSAVKAYFMPGDSASENLTLVASASNWNGVTQLQLDGAAPAVTSADDGSNKVVNVAKSTAVNISGENLTLSPYNPYTVITASLDNPSKVYDGTAFLAQVSFAVGGSPLEGLTEGYDYNITYTDGNATGETNANANNGTYSLTVALTGTASDGTQYVFDDQGTKEKTFTYTITPLEVTGTWSVRGLEITYGDSDSTLDASHIVINLTEDTIPGGLTERYIVAKGFNSDYVQGTTQAGETVTIFEVDFDITEDNGIIADNYTLNITAGENTVEVQKKEITISAAADLNPDAAGHIEATYGGENYVNSQDSLAALLTWAEIGGYVNGRYDSDEIGFTITQVAHEGDTEAPGTAVGSGEWAKLPANDRYYITVESTNSNYTVAQGNYFTYYIAPAELTIDSVVWSGTNNNTTTYNGSAQTFTVNASGLVEGDNLEDVISTSVTYNNAVHSGDIINAGTYTVTVGLKQEGGNYDPSFGVENTYDLTISPITLTPSPVNGTFTEYTSSNLPGGTDFVTSGILESDSGVSVAVTWGSNAPADSVVGNGNYVAANTYTASLAIQGDTNNNYTLLADTATFTIEAYDLENATITVEASGLVYDGTAKTATVTVKAGEADITDLVTITGNTQTNAGNSYTVSISSKDSNTTGFKKAETTWSIAKATITIAGVSEALTSEYSGEAVDPADLLSATYITVSGAASGENVYSMLTATSADGEILNYKEGGYTITIALNASVSGSANYQISGSNTITYTIQKKAVTITWSAGDIILGTEADQIRVTHDDNNGIVSGEEYTFTVDNDYNAGTAQVGTQVTFSNPRVTFTVGDENNYSITFNPADQIQVSVVLPNITITVTQATVSVDYLQGYTTQNQFMDNFNLGGAGHNSFTITVTNTLQGGQPEQLDARLDVGTYTVEISSTQYIISGTTTYTYEVTPHNLSDVVVTATAENFVYNGSAQTATVTVMAGDENITSLFSVSGNSQTNAGNHNVQVTARTPGNFTGNFSASSVTNWSIAQLPVQISWSAPGSLVYTGSAFEMTATITNKVETDNVTAIVKKHSGDNINVTDDGFTYSVTALAGAAAENYTIKGVENIAVTYKILPATLTVAEGVATATFGEVRVEEGSLLNAISSKISGAVGEQALADIVSVSTFNTTVTWNNVAYYTANESGSAVTVTIKDSNYTFAEGSNTAEITLVINKLQDVINVADEKSATYYDAYQANGANFFTVSTVSGFPVTIEWSDEWATELTAPEVGQPITWEVTTVYADVEVDYSGNEALAANFTAAQPWHSSSGFSLNNRDVTVEVDLQSMDKIYDGNGFESFDIITTFYDTDSDPKETPVPQTELEIEVAKGFDGRIDPANAIAAGEYSVYIQGDRLNVKIVYANNKETFTIGKATLTLAQVEGAPLSRDYDGNTTDANTFVNEAYVTVEGYVDDEGTAYDLLTATVAGDKTIKDADTYTITVALASASGNYTLTASVNLTYTVNPKTLTADSVVWTDPEDYTYNGSAIAPTPAWASGAIVTGDTVNITITISAQDGSEITDNQAINAGSYTAAATIAAGDASRNYKLVADVTYDFTIARKAVTITWTDGASDNFTYTYDGTAKAPTASVTEGAVAPDTFADINDWATIDGALTDDQAINAGSYTARITQAAFEEAYDNYTIERDSERQFTIDPATVTVTMTMKDAENNDVTSPLTWNVNSAIVVAGAENGWTLTSGETVYTITVTGFESVVGFNSSKLKLYLDKDEYTGTPYGTPVSDGELGIVSADPNYEISTTNPIRFNVVPSLAIELPSGAEISVVYDFNKSYDAAADTNNAFAQYFAVQTSDDSDAPAGTWSYTVVGDNQAQTIQDVGTYTIEATYTVTDGGAILKNSIKFSITPATVRQISIASGEKYQYNYGELTNDSTIKVTVTYSDNSAQDITATFTASMSSGGYVNAGNNVTLTLTGSSSSDNYENLTGRETDVVSVGIFKAEITAVDVYYADTHAEGGVLTLPYKGSSGYDIILAKATSGVLDNDVVELTVTPASQIVGVNTYALTIALAENGDYANYELNVGTNYSVEVTPAEITVNWGDTTEFTYNGSAQAPVPTATGTFNNDVVNLGDKVIVTEQGGSESVTPINAGTYTATVAAFTEGNYKLSENATCEFTIGKGNATLSITDYDKIKSKTYDSQAVNIAPVVSMAGGGQVTADVAVTIMLNDEQVNEVRNAGTYSVTLSIANNNNINDVTSEAFTFTISKASVSVSTTTTDFTYDGNAVDIDAMGAASASTIYDNEATLVAKATLNGEPAEMKNAGTYSVTFTLEGEGAGNYEITTTDPVSVTINARVVTISWTEDETFTYNGTAQAPTFTVNNLAEGEELELTAAITAGTGSALTDDKAVNAGNYTATIAAASISGNYRLEADATTDFTIARRQVEITWTGETFTYNGTAQAPTFTVNNLAEGDELELTAAITGNVTDGKAINAGDYTATIAAFTQGNYTLAEASEHAFTIGKANLTLTPASVTFSEKDENSLAAYSQSSYEATIKDKVTVTGVADDVITEYTVNTEATFDDTTGYLVTDGENAGTYTFTITAGANYNTATYTVTVTAQQTITITAMPSSDTYTGSEITFTFKNGEQEVTDVEVEIVSITYNSGTAESVLNAGSYTVTFNVNNSDEAVYWYEVRDWTGTIAAAEVTVTEATLSAIYGEVYTAEATGVAVQNVNGWSVATFNGAPVEATVAIDQTAAAAALPGETIYLRASETAYNVIITLTSDNFKFADDVSVVDQPKQMRTTLTVEKKELDVTTPTDLESLTYTSEGVVIEIADISEDIVGSDNVTVTIMVDGEPYEPGVTVLSAGEHTITYAISGNGNYAISADSAVGQTFTIAPKAASDSITVSGERVESGGTVEITTGENLRVDTAINNYIAQNGVAEGEYTVTATDSQGNEVDIDRVSSWAPGDYTISVNLGENFSGGEMTFTISVAEGTTTEIPDPPTTPSTPIVDDGGSGNNWLFPLIIAIECVIALALIAAIVITAIKRSKNA